MFNAEYGKAKPQLDFIEFLDGHEWRKKQSCLTSIHSNVSWKRSKWFIRVQNTILVNKNE